LEMRSDEAVVRLQRATLMGGEQAEKEAQGARAVLSSLGVVHPDRFAAMLVPMPP